MKNLFVSMNASIIIVLLVNTYIITSFASRNHHVAAPKDGDAHYSHDKSVMEACGHQCLVDICKPVLQDGDDIFGGHACCGRGGGPFKYRIHPHGKPIEYTPNWVDPLAPHNHPHDTGLTALHRAAAHGYIEIINLLLEAGWSNNVVAENGEMPSDAARRNGHEKIADALEATMESEEL